ncbi:MAG: glycosyltransferase, partial [Candidatus Binatia bacterium]
MKILHVDPERGFGGGERQVLGLVRHLARRGHENVLAAPVGSPLWRMLPDADARRAALAIRNDVDLVAAVRLARLVAAEASDVVHFHTSRAHAMSLWLPRSSRRSIVTRRMDYPIRPGLRTSLLYDRRVAGVAAISEEVRRQLFAAGVDPARIRLIPSGVEVPDGLPGPAGREAARARFGAGEAMVLAVVAALERRKGHDVLLHALADLSSRGIRFHCLLCGDGSER